MAVFTMNMIGVVDLIPPVISHLEDAQGNTVASLSVDENSAPGTVVGTVVADASAYSFAIVGGSSTFAISNTGQITVSNNSALDYETTTSLSFQVTASDYANNVSAALSVTVNILDVDDTPPVVTKVSQNYTSVLEDQNNLTIASFTASDAGTDVTNTLTLSGSPNTTNFSLVYNSSTQQMDLVTASSGQLGGGVNSDQTFTFTVSTSDAVGNVGSATCSLTVRDIAPPNITGDTSITRTENTSTSTTIENYDSTGTTPITWSLSGTDAGDFTIDTSGRLKFAVSPDYENPADSGGNNVYNLNVVATNAYGSDSHAVTVTVTNSTLDDPPVITSGPSSISAVEKSHGVIFAVYEASQSNPLNWSVGGTDGSAFAMNDYGRLFKNGGGYFDYDNPIDSNGDNVYNITINVSNSYGSDSMSVTVTITDDPNWP